MAPLLRPIWSSKALPLIKGFEGAGFAHHGIPAGSQRPRSSCQSQCRTAYFELPTSPAAHVSYRCCSSNRRVQSEMGKVNAR